MTQPYVYSMVSKQGHLYYGCRHAKGCHPDELGVTYFSSSKKIASLIQNHGKDFFMYEVESLCEDSAEALRVESELIETIHKDPMCLNRYHTRKDGSVVYFGNSGPLPDWHKKLLSKLFTGKPKPEGFGAGVTERNKQRSARQRIWQHARARKCATAWAKADQFYQLWKNEKWGHERFCNRMNDGKNVRTFYNMFTMFRGGWVPLEDPEWSKDFQ